MPVTVSRPGPSMRAWVVGLSMALLPLVVPVAQASDTAVAAAPTYTLEDLLTQARQQSPALATHRARIEAVQAGLITARALPNPELGIEPGRLNPGRPGERGASSFAMSFAQPIENPRLRAARLASAEGQVAVARADGAVLETGLRSAIRDRFFELLKLRAEQAALQEDLKLAEQIRDRIALRVQVGEAARFDVLRAEGEVALVRRQLDAVGLRLRETRLLMRQLVGPGLAENFEVATSEADNRLLGEGDVQTLRRELSERNPDIAQARASLEGSRRQLELERSRVVPQLSLRAVHERDGPAQLTRIGAQITVPLLDRRAGPIAEAIAEGERARLALEQRRFETEAAFEAAWVAYRTALAQVQAIEGGVLDRARQVLAIAEAAYRLGERGILEFLDAQRQFRQVRNELIGARLDLQRARTDLERLAGR